MKLDVVGHFMDDDVMVVSGTYTKTWILLIMHTSQLIHGNGFSIDGRSDNYFFSSFLYKNQYNTKIFVYVLFESQSENEFLEPIMLSM